MSLRLKIKFDVRGPKKLDATKIVASVDVFVSEAATGIGLKKSIVSFFADRSTSPVYRPRCKKSQTKARGRIAAMEFAVLWLKILGTLAMQLVSIWPSTSQVGKFIILSWQRNPGEVNESFLPRPSLARNEKKSWLQPFVVLPNFFKIEMNCRIVHA